MITLQPHRIADEHFDALASGYGDEQTLALLIEGQFSRRKLLLRALSDEISALPASYSVKDEFEAGCALLAEIEASAPAAVTGPDGALRNPYLGVWAMQCLRELLGGRDQVRTLARLSERMSYFSAFVAVAAARAGRDLELEVVVPESGLAFPMWGLLSPRFAGQTARIAVSGGEIVVRCDGPEPVEVGDRTRALADGPHPIRLEDTDPFRDAFGYPVTDRLSDDQVARWRSTFTAGWQEVAENHREYLPALAAGLCSITPLREQPSGADASAASRHAFGAIGMIRPPTAARLAVLLIHEFQHVKLGALLDLVTLHDDSDTRLYRAPWRPDPRPLPALLQGTYAHLGVTDFWRRHRLTVASADEAARASEQFGHWRRQTADVIDLMLASSALTDAGRRFVSGMGARIAPWLDEELS